ncbi:hypothetical protein PSACC_00098 [Paramicrosporidium saccamoebae]|uniref:Uncharacterized protein n=1 Tax=Paramicrosporidium saccamoebae TaxID=1246581 RepID=A0A2H9TQR2_9FUNG|nr:hypothetical protein PSACC_00098 [Paramicrosporidium saccamoebae]
MLRIGTAFIFAHLANIADTCHSLTDMLCSHWRNPTLAPIRKRHHTSKRLHSGVPEHCPTNGQVGSQCSRAVGMAAACGKRTLHEGQHEGLGCCRRNCSLAPDRAVDILRGAPARTGFCQEAFGGELGLRCLLNVLASAMSALRGMQRVSNKSCYVLTQPVFAELTRMGSECGYILTMLGVCTMACLSTVIQMANRDPHVHVLRVWLLLAASAPFMKGTLKAWTAISTIVVLALAIFSTHFAERLDQKADLVREESQSWVRSGRLPIELLEGAVAEALR